jgi:outer membrane biosynthesis protein TonB
VEIAVIVDPSGKVVRARVAGGPRLLEAAALEAAGAYVFRPGRKRGLAVYTEVIIEITFTVPRS